MRYSGPYAATFSIRADRLKNASTPCLRMLTFSFKNVLVSAKIAVASVISSAGNATSNVLLNASSAFPPSSTEAESLYLGILTTIGLPDLLGTVTTPSARSFWM